MTILLLQILLSCDQPKPTVTDVFDQENESTIDSSIDPIWTKESIPANLNELLEFGIPYPSPILELYQNLYDEGGTSDCPGTNYNFDGSQVDNAGCTTDDGYFYAGAAELRVEEDSFELHCDCRIVTPDGRMIRGAGNISVLNSDEGTLYDIRGSFLSHDEYSPAPWLSELPSLNLLIGVHNQETVLLGGYTINGMSIYFDHLRLRDCEERNGSLLIRDPSGGWWTWLLENSCTEGQLFFQDEFIDTMTWDSQILDEQINLFEIAQ